MNPMDDIVQRAVREVRARTEMEILTGCVFCGRRVIEDGMPIAGALLVEVDNVNTEWLKDGECLLTFNAPFPVCGTCFGERWPNGV